MKKIIHSLLMTALLSLLLYVPVFAAKSSAPGLNMLTSDTAPFAFEGNTASYDGILYSDGSAVSDNPFTTGINPSARALCLTFSGADTYPTVMFTLPKAIEGERPIYVSFKYLKTYEPKNGETPNPHYGFWIMKNGTTYIADSPASLAYGSAWQAYRGFPAFGHAFNAGNQSEISEGATTSIILETGVLSNPGKTRIYFDDITFMPAYRVAYHADSEIVESEYVLFDEDGALLDSVRVDLTKTTEKYGYTLVGWSLDENAAVPLEGASAVIPLENHDIDLYAVWEKSEDVPDPVETRYDFETDETCVFAAGGKGYGVTYENGIMDVDLGKVSGPERTNTYVTYKDAVSLDTASHRFLTFTLANHSSANALYLYYMTTDHPAASEAQTVMIPITPNTERFETYTVDMSAYELWSGSFTGWMLCALGADSGHIQFEEIRFHTLPDEEKPAKKEYHYDLTHEQFTSSWAQCSSKATDGGVLITKKSEAEAGGEGGALYLPTLESGKASVTDMPYLIFKARTEDVNGIKSFYVYYANQDYGYAEQRTDTTRSMTLDGYTYFYINWLEKLGRDVASGYYTSTMYFPWEIGSVKLCDIYYASELPQESGSADVEKFALYAGKNTISEEGGTLTVTPYVRLSDGSVLISPAVRYGTDSVCAALTVNDDGSVTLRGKMNGDILLKASLRDDPSVRASFRVTVSGQTEKTVGTKIRYVSFGNSIHRHPVSDGIGWHDEWGMAASSEENDYVHRLIAKLEAKYGIGSIEHVFGTDNLAFETSIVNQTPTSDISSTIPGLTEYIAGEQPDIVTVQYGENVGATDAATYENAFTQFVAAIRAGAPDAIVLITTPFWGGPAKIDGARTVAKKLDLPLAELAPFGIPEYEAIGLFEHSGVAAHPGDKGMEAIADAMNDALCVYMTERIDPNLLYTVLPASVKTDKESYSITLENGTVKINAAVYPLDAAQDVDYSVSNPYIASVDASGTVTGRNNGTVTLRVASRYASDVYTEVRVTISGQTPAHTVTYHPNTTDAVRNMPAPNVYAKGTFVFDNVIPARDCYRFVGWALTPDSQAVETLDVSSDMTVYAVWEKAVKWSFDRTGDKEGFTVDDGFNQYVLDGYFMTVATGTDEAGGNLLTVHSPVLSVDPHEYDLLTLRIRNTAFGGQTTLRLTVKTETGAYDLAQKVVTTEYTSYVFDLSAVAGTITGFSFRPTDMDCTLYMDEIAFMSSSDYLLRYDANAPDVGNLPVGVCVSESDTVPLTKEIPVRDGYTFLGWTYEKDSRLIVEESMIDYTAHPILYALWDKNDHIEFDSEAEFTYSSITLEDLTDGILHYTGGGDPIVSPKVFGGFDVSETSGAIHVRIRWAGEGDTFTQLFYRTSASDTISEANSRSEPLKGNDWQTLTLDMTKNNAGTVASGWNGCLNGMRFDLTASAGEAYVDYVRFADSDANIVTASGQTRRVSTDDASYIVRKGGTLAPAGRTELSFVATNGGVDMTNGYIVLTDRYEIGADADCAAVNFAAAMGDIVRFENGCEVKVSDGDTYLLPIGCTVRFYTASSDTPYAVGYIRRDGTAAAECAVREADALVVRFTANEEMCVVAAAYDINGRLAAVRILSTTDTPQAEYEAILPNAESAAVVRLFAFDRLDSVVPCAAVRQISDVR